VAVVEAEAVTVAVTKTDSIASSGPVFKAGPDHCVVGLPYLKDFT